MNVVPQAHPSREELAAFGAGKLNAVQSDEIERHLDQCDACCRLLNAIPDDDTLVIALRDAETDASPNRESMQAAVTLPPDGDHETRRPRPDATEFAAARGASAAAELPAELQDHPRYRIVELLGRGGMGDVYRAEHKVMNRPVALKVIKPELVQNDAAVRRFHREVQAAARLHHPNIVTAYDAEQAGDLHYLVMEFVDGVDLDEILRERGPLPVEEACDFIRQAAAGLQHAHELGMVHRDIKPHNLMAVGMRNEGKPAPSATVKILDFGLASLASEAFEGVPESGGRQPTASEALPQLTQMGAMMGTPDYIAPEQAEDAHQADIRADIYSLGCTFYTLLAGRPPFGEGAVLDKVLAHLEQDPPPLSDFRDDVPAEVETVIQKMMAKDPAERYAVPAEVTEALARFIDERIDEKLRERGAGAGPPQIAKPVGVDESGADKHVVSAAAFLMAVGFLNLAYTVLVSYRLVPWPEWMEIPGVGILTCILWGLPMMLGAWRMFNRQSYRWSVVTAIMAMTPVTP
ncbi:MAG: serine/threonine protein kinase, partial [Planctomycetes bacterium]|nr:serine/threonine protein kinase [Planctomycetota bacterium]